MLKLKQELMDNRIALEIAAGGVFSGAESARPAASTRPSTPRYRGSPDDVNSSFTVKRDLFSMNTLTKWILAIAAVGTTGTAASGTVELTPLMLIRPQMPMRQPPKLRRTKPVVTVRTVAVRQGTLRQKLHRLRTGHGAAQRRHGRVGPLRIARRTNQVTPGQESRRARCWAT